MAQIPATRGNPHASEIAVQTALPMVGSLSREDLQATLGLVDGEMAKLFEDRNLLLVSDGTITFPAAGTSVTFSSNLRLHINSQVAGGAPTVIDLGSSTRTLSASGRMLYATINRTAGTASITDDATSLPSQTSANQEIVLIAKRVDATDSTKRIYFRNGFTLSAGQTARFGQGGTVYDTEFVVADITDTTKQIKFDAAGTTGTSTTITGSQTTNKILTLPDITDTLVSRTNTETLSGKQVQYSVSTDSATTGATATLASFTTGVIRLTNASLTSISGIPAGASGQVLIVENKTGTTITLLNDDAGATAANRVFTGTGGTVTMLNNATFAFTYDTTNSRWMLTGGSGSGSGSGGINYITYGDAESGTQGWAAYADAAGTRPVDGTGGSPNVTFTASTSSPLRGLTSFLFTKDAANRQGQGVSYDFTIDAADKAKVLQISAEYIVVSGTFNAGTSSTDSDIIFDIYDVTNGIIIEPSSIKLLNNSTSTSDKFIANFQTSSNSTSYRLIMHVASTNASTFVVQFDSIKVSPSTYVYGTPITDWKSYTPTFTGIPGGSSEGFFWRRVGDSVEIRGSFTTGTPDGTAFSITMPAGLSADASKLASQTNSNAVGHVYSIRGTATEQFAGVVGGPFVAFTDTSVNANLIYTAQDANGSRFEKDAANELFVSGTRGVADGILVPILGWSGSVQMSDQTDTRVVAANVYKGSAQAFTSGVTTKVTLDTVGTDKAGMFDNANNRILIRVAGTYKIYGQITFASHGTNDRIVNIYKNGSNVAASSTKSAATIPSTSTVETTLELIAGDYIELYGLQNSGVAINANGTSDVTFLTVTRLSGPSAIAATESINAGYNTSTTSFNSTTTAYSTVVYTVKEADTHGIYNTSTGIGTIPIPGKYLISAGVHVVSNSDQVNRQLVLDVYKNGSSVASHGECQASTGSTVRFATVTKLVTFVAGDTFNLSVSGQFQQGSISLSGTSTTNYFSIVRVGN